LTRRAVLAGSAGAAGAVALAGSRRRTGAAPAVIAHQGGDVEITFLHIWGTPPGEEARAKHPADQLVEAFNAKGTGVVVNARTDSTDYFEVLQKAQAEMAAGNPPALVATPWSNIYFADEGLGITNLEDVAAAAGEEISAVLGNLKEEVIGLVTLDGTTKGVPFAFSCPVVYYNADVLASAAVDPAALLTDWDAFAALGAEVHAATGNPIVGVGTNHDWPAQSIIQSNGGRVLDDDLQPAMDSAEAVGAMETIAALNEAGLFTVAATAENRASFVSGAMALFLTSIAGLGGLRNEVTFEMGTSPFPVFPDKPRMMSSGGSFLGCYARDDEQMAATWEFLKFAVSQEGTDIWMQTGYLNATIFEVPLLPGQEAAVTQLQEGLTRETSWPGPRGAEIQKVWGTYVERIWANDISAAEGAAAAKEEILALMP
jgi:multiple sugar transport system substrate-binding protein